MKRNLWFHLLVVCGLLLALAGSAAAQGPAPAGGMSIQTAMGTAFSYQGYLEDAGGPVSADCDFKFSLYDALTGGSQVGTTQTVTGVGVASGKFIVLLDFGAGMFDGNARWLELQVACPTGSSYTPLNPRQEMTPTPYALYASNVGAHDHWGESWSGSGTGLTLSGGSTGLSATGTGNGVSAAGSNNGVYGLNTSTSGTGVFGYTIADGGSTIGVRGQSESSSGKGVYGVAGASSGTPYGVYGMSASTTGRGVYGKASASSGTTYGVFGQSASTTGRGVYGEASASSGATYGVYGLSVSTTGRGMYGEASAGSGTTYGVYGRSASTSGTGVYGYVSASSGTTNGVYGYSSSTGGRGVYGVAGATSGNAYGVKGESWSSSGKGVLGVAGASSGTTYGVYGTAVSPDGYSGYFTGKVYIGGPLEKPAGSFKIDHPLDPANKYLYHSFVESPDMMNVYNGNITLEADGTAWVQMPDWFQALNQDFRYQLTAIGAPGPNLYIAQEIAGNRFQIAGGEPGMKVSWQVTGIRHDAYAEAHRIPVEEAKPAEERGTYLHPVEQGQPKESGLDYQRNAEPSAMNAESRESGGLER